MCRWWGSQTLEPLSCVQRRRVNKRNENLMVKTMALALCNNSWLKNVSEQNVFTKKKKSLSDLKQRKVCYLMENYSNHMESIPSSTFSVSFSHKVLAVLR